MKGPNPGVADVALVAQLVEHHASDVRDMGSNPVKCFVRLIKNGF